MCKNLSICITLATACKKENDDLGLPLFGSKTIAAATNNFSDENLIGEGGFGPVYKVMHYFKAESEIVYFFGVFMSVCGCCRETYRVS